MGVASELLVFVDLLAGDGVSEVPSFLLNLDYIVSYVGVGRANQIVVGPGLHSIVEFILGRSSFDESRLVVLPAFNGFHAPEDDLRYHRGLSLTRIGGVLTEDILV